MSFFLLLKAKEDILKNVSNQTVDRPHISILWKSMESMNCLVTHIPQKNLLLCSAEERNSYRFGSS